MLALCAQSGERSHTTDATHRLACHRIGGHYLLERLGHSAIAITLDIYSHVLPGLQEVAARQFEQGLDRAEAQATEIGLKNVGKLGLKVWSAV